MYQLKLENLILINRCPAAEGGAIVLHATPSSTSFARATKRSGDLVLLSRKAAY